MSQHPASKPPMSMGKKAAVATTTLIAIVILTVVVGLLVRSHKSKAHPDTAPSPSSSATQPDGPDGCVGGADPTTAISTAFNEPPTERGAVQFTATLFRWMLNSDTTPSQLQNVGGRLAEPKVIAPYKGVFKALPSGAHVGYNTKNSYAWVKAFDAKKGTATVVLTGELDGSADAHTVQRQIGHEVSLTRRDDHWFVSATPPGAGGSDTSDAAYNKFRNDVVKHGRPLAGGCSA